jgi:hypothetical protein
MWLTESKRTTSSGVEYVPAGSVEDDMVASLKIASIIEVPYPVAPVVPSAPAAAAAAPAPLASAA